MKILYYSPHPYLNLASPAGAGTHMREMIAAFRRQGHEVSVCILGGEHLYGDLAVRYTSAGRRGKLKSFIPQILWQSAKDLRLLIKDRQAGALLHQQVEAFQPELIYERGFYLMRSGVRLAGQLAIPHILEMNAPFLEEKLALEGKTLLAGAALKAEDYQLSRSNRVTVVSSSLKSYFEAHHPGCRGKVMVVPNAINPDSFTPDPEAVERVRTRLGLESGHLVIGFVGSILPYHGIQDLIECFGRLASSPANQHLQLLIVGDGESLPGIRAGIQDRSWVKRVHFTGNVPHQEVRNYIAIMDITVLANSGWYNSPIKIFEYGAMGKAIVSIASPPVRDVMRDGEHGVLFESTATDLLPALEKLIQNPGLRQELAQRFEEKVRREHTWDAMASAVLKGFGG